MREAGVLQLRRHLNAVLSRRPGQALGLWGEAGVGKSFTAQALLRETPCPSLSLHATTAAGAIAAALPRPSQLPAWAERGLAQLAQGEAPGGPAAVNTLAAALSALSPFVLHLEDLHEAGPEQVQLVRGLAGAVARLRGVGLLVTSRSEPPAPFRALRLAPLERPDLDGLLAGRSGAALPREGLDWVFARTGGNPLFALEFWRYLARQGSFWSDGQRWHWRPPPEGFVPVSVEALILELVERAADTQAARALLEARALLPTDLDPVGLRALWAEAAGLGPAALDEARHLLEQRGVLQGDSFVHPLFGEVVAGTLGGEARRQLARRIVEARRDIAPGPLAHFVGLAEMGPEEALALYTAAAAAAGQRGAEVQAAYLLGLAAEQAGGEAGARLALEAEAGLLPTGDYRRREALARLALEAQPESREARLALATICALTHRADEVLALVEALPQAEQQETRWLEVRFRALFVVDRNREAVALWEAHAPLRTLPGGRSTQYAIGAYIDLGEFERAEALIHSVLTRADLTDRVRLATLNALALLRSDQGRPEAAADLYEQIIDLARAGGNQNNIGVGHYNRALNRARLGQFGAALDDAAEGARLFDQTGNAVAAAHTRVFQAHLLLQQGHFEAAEELLLTANEVFGQRSAGPQSVSCATELALLYAAWRPPHGRALAQKFVRAALEGAQACGDASARQDALATAAQIALWRGEAAEALALAEAGLQALEPETAGSQVYRCQAALAAALEASGQPAGARARWQAALEAALGIQFQREIHEARLAIARLDADWDGMRRLRAWFVEHGLALGVRQADDGLPARAPRGTEPVVAPARLLVLGSVALERHGQPLPSRARRRLEILACLLEARIAGRPEAGVLELLDSLYPDVPELEARNTLKQQVYLIRSALGPGSVRSTPTGYALGEVSSDAEDFLRSGEPDLWRGAYLGDLGPGWREGVREALTLGLRASAETQLDGDPAQAARLGQLWLEMEPYELQALRLSVEALQRQGNARAAQRVYGQAQARLQEVGEALPARLEDFLGTSVAT